MSIQGGLVQPTLFFINKCFFPPKVIFLIFKDYRYHAFPNTEFSYVLIIDTRQYELPNYLLKIGGPRPLKADMT